MFWFGCEIIHSLHATRSFWYYQCKMLTGYCLHSLSWETYVLISFVYLITQSKRCSITSIKCYTHYSYTNYIHCSAEHLMGTYILHCSPFEFQKLVVVTIVLPVISDNSLIFFILQNHLYQLKDSHLSRFHFLWLLHKFLLFWVVIIV